MIRPEAEIERVKKRLRKGRSLLPFLRGILAGAGGALIGVGIATGDVFLGLSGIIAVAIPMAAITIRKRLSERRHRQSIEAMIEEIGPTMALSAVARAVVGPEGIIVEHNMPWQTMGLPLDSVPEPWIDAVEGGRERQFAVAETGRQIEVGGRTLGGIANYFLFSVRDVVEPARVDPGIFEHADLGWFEIGDGGRVTAVNATLANWLGRQVEDFADGAIGIFDVFRPSDHPDVGDDRYRADLLPVDEAPFPVEVVLQSGGGDTRAKGGLVIDLREIVRSVEALAESAERFGRFIDDAPVGIAALAADGRVEEANPVFAELASGTAEPERVLGQDLYTLVDWPTDDTKPVGDFAQVLAGAEGASAELRFKATPSQTMRLFATRESRMQGENQTTRIVYMLDVSAQKALEEQFVQSQKMQAVGQLAGGIAHDFNNLLTAIIGFCDLLLSRHGPEDDSFPDIMQIKQNANRAANLVRQLLAFSRRQTLRPKVIDIRDTLNDLSTLLRRLIGANIRLDLEHAQDLGLVRVDPSQFDQVIINLVVNARDAMTEGGRILIRTRNMPWSERRTIAAMQLPAADYVLIEVSDTGHGIPRDVLPKIFEPFFTTKEVGAGTGLGLSTVYGIVKQTGGSIVVESEAGHGTLFRIALPRHVAGVEEAGDGVAEAAERTEGAAPGHETILIVEDEDAVRNFAVRALRRQGYEVLDAPTGEEAIEIIESQDGRIDLLISDVVMPSMDGPSLAR
ncbi:MAG: ATP-binding protein, partial [Zavarzinia sp.]|nr:ATP-binding protein [Zavarzinia sp.]